MKPDLIRHLNGESIGHYPVWLMRQAGRYLESYRAIRKDHSFWEMVTTPDLAVKVSLLPLDVIDVDAVIFFSDILTLPYGLGIPIEMKEAIGPVVTSPLREESAFSIFTDFNAKKHTEYVADALSTIRCQMPKEKTLIGFAGAPWTVGCYLVQGRGKNEFTEMAAWEKRDPAELARALGKLGQATVNYLESQIEAGADIVQLFDTWLSQMSPSFFREFYVPMLNEIFAKVQAKGVKVIYFSKGSREYLPEFSRLRCDVLGVDDSFDIVDFEARTGKQYSLQGNLSPETLLGSMENVRSETRKLVARARELSRPPILNLGHGVFPKTPVENVKAFVEEARALWI